MSNHHGLNTFMIKGIVIFTVIEALTLIGWLSLTGINAILAIAVLLIGLFLEHFISFNVKNKRPILKITGLPAGFVFLVAIVETITWAVWLALTGINVILSVAVLFVGLIFGHGLELNVVHRLMPFQRFGSRLLKTIDITIIETFAGVIWLMLVEANREVTGGAVLAVLLLVEHFVSSGKK